MIPIGSPSTGESGRPAAWRAADSSAAARAAASSITSQAMISSSRAAIASRQCSNSARGLSVPSRKAGTRSWKVIIACARGS